MASKEDIRPIYSELQGYLSQAPDPKESHLGYQISIVECYHKAIGELNQISQKDYTHYQVGIKCRPNTKNQFFSLSEYRSKLGGLISRLHGKYFADEPPPFSGMPTTIISQNQAQSQSVQVQILLDLQSKIDEKLHEFEEGSKERTFLEKLKGSLSSVKGIVGLIALLTKMASEYDLTIEQLREIFQ